MLICSQRAAYCINDYYSSHPINYSSDYRQTFTIILFILGVLYQWATVYDTLRRLPTILMVDLGKGLPELYELRHSTQKRYWA